MAHLIVDDEVDSQRDDSIDITADANKYMDNRFSPRFGDISVTGATFFIIPMYIFFCFVTLRVSYCTLLSKVGELKSPRGHHLSPGARVHR